VDPCCRLGSRYRGRILGAHNLAASIASLERLPPTRWMACLRTPPTPRGMARRPCTRSSARAPAVWHVWTIPRQRRRGCAGWSRCGIAPSGVTLPNRPLTLKATAPHRCGLSLYTRQAVVDSAESGLPPGSHNLPDRYTVPGGAGMPGLRILMVDDHFDTLQLYETYLSLQGYSVTTTTNATDGLRLSTNGFDAIVTDLAMPGNGRRRVHPCNANRANGGAHSRCRGHRAGRCQEGGGT